VSGLQAGWLSLSGSRKLPQAEHNIDMILLVIKRLLFDKGDVLWYQMST